MEEKDETLQHPSESEEIEEMKAASDDSAAVENNSLAEEDQKDDAPPELSAAQENETISADAALTAPAISEAEPEFSEFQFSEDDLKTLPGPILYKIYPHRFDNRLEERQRTGVSPEQWDSHIEQSACALCGVPGGKCDCRIEGDIKAQQKLIWSY